MDSSQRPDWLRKLPLSCKRIRLYLKSVHRMLKVLLLLLLHHVFTPPMISAEGHRPLYVCTIPFGYMGVPLGVPLGLLEAYLGVTWGLLGNYLELLGVYLGLNWGLLKEYLGVLWGYFGVTWG